MNNAMAYSARMSYCSEASASERSNRRHALSYWPAFMASQAREAMPAARWSLRLAGRLISLKYSSSATSWRTSSTRAPSGSRWRYSLSDSRAPVMSFMYSWFSASP